MAMHCDTYQPAFLTSPSACNGHVRDGLADMALRTFLNTYPEVAFAKWVRGDVAVVDLLRVPEHQRRQGIGSIVYLLWERTLTEGMRVELFAVDEDATAFWRSLGFEGRENDVMHKTVPARQGHIEIVGDNKLTQSGRQVAQLAGQIL